MTILIAGGGIAGCVLGLTLHQLGLPFRLYERVADPKPLGVGINLQPNAVRSQRRRRTLVQERQYLEGGRHFYSFACVFRAFGSRSRNRGRFPCGQAVASLTRDGSGGTKAAPGTAKRSPRNR